MLCRLHQPWQSRRVRLPGPWGAQSGLTVARGRRDWLWRRSRAAAAGRGVGTAPVNCVEPCPCGQHVEGARQVWPRLASLSAQVAGARAFKVFLGKAPSCSRRDNECASLRRSCKDLEMVIWRQRQVGRGSHYSYFTKRNHDKVTDGNGNKLHQWRHHIQISWF